MGTVDLLTKATASVHWLGARTDCPWQPPGWGMRGAVCTRGQPGSCSLEGALAQEFNIVRYDLSRVETSFASARDGLIKDVLMQPVAVSVSAGAAKG